MKKLLFIFVLTLLTVIVTAQDSKTIHVTAAGTLTNLLTLAEKTTIKNLTITGYTDARDMKCIRDEMPMIEVLDMSEATLKAYIGSEGTFDTGTVEYRANEMPKYSFYNSYLDKGKSTLTTFIFPTNLTSIGDDAFVACGLTSVNFPDKLTNIGYYAFAACTRLINITLPPNLTTLGIRVFYNCYRINTVTLPLKFTSIGPEAFCGCSGIKIINCLNPIPPTVNANSPFYDVSPTVVYVPATSEIAYKTAPVWSMFKSVIKADTTSSIYSINIRSSVGGIVTSKGCQMNDGEVVTVLRNSNTTVNFIFTPVVGYEITSLLLNNEEVKSQIINNQYTTPVVNENINLKVTFQKIQFRLCIKSAECGTINWLCEYGATPSYEFTPSTGWKVNTIIYNGNDVTGTLKNGVYTIPAMMDNGLLSVSFVNVSSAPLLINSNLKVFTIQSEIIIDGTSEGEKVFLYSINGKQIQVLTSQGERMSISAQRNAVYLVRIGETIFKVIL